MERKKLSQLTSKLQSGNGILAKDIKNSGLYPVFGGNGLRGYTESYNEEGAFFFIGRQGAKCGNVHYHVGKAYMTEHAIVGKTNADNDAIYLSYKLSLLDLGKLQGQSAQPGLAVGTLAEVELDVPSLIEQRKVANLLYKIDQKISLNTRMNAELEAMAKQLYDYWFVQFDFPDENGHPYKSSGGEMVYNSTLKREIPAGWEFSTIGDLISTERGISYSTPNIISGNGIPMLNLATFMPGGGDYKASGLKHYLGEYPPNKVLKPYDLIMCNTQQTAIKFETDIIGRAMLVPDIFEDEIVFSHHVNIIKTKNDDLKYYLLYLFNSDYYHKYISGYTNGTNILGLSFNGVSDYNLEIPPDSILKQFASLILDIAKKKSLIFKESSNLTHLRDSLLPMLMNGQVTVEE